MKTGPVRDAQQMKKCVYNIPCDCGRCYIGETSRPLKVCIKEHKYNLTQGLLEKSKLAQHAYREGHKICCWNEAKVLQTEPNTTYRKYKESAHISLINHLISQPSLDISPIWTHIITVEVKSYKYFQCRLSGKIVFFVLVPYREFVSSVMTSSLIVLWCKVSYVWSF
jgi:hypothetical protein